MKNLYLLLGVRPDATVAQLNARVDDALVVRTHDGLDRVTFDGYLGLIPDASTLRIAFADGTELAGDALRARITTVLTPVASGQ